MLSTVAILMDMTYRPSLMRVTKGNELVEARLANFKMTASQNRIIAWLAAMVHSQKDQDFQIVRTSVTQLNQIVGHKYSSKQLTFELTDLRTATAVIREGDISTICGIVDVARINHKTGEVELKLGEEMKPYLLRLGENQKGFTSYLLDAFLVIRSASSQRIFELMMQWRTRGEVIYELMDFKRKISLLVETSKGWDEKYPKWMDFEKRVLRQAEEDLCNAGLHIIYEPIKSGRKVTHIRFVMFENTENMADLKEQYRKLFMYSLSDYQRVRIAYANRPADIERAIIECDRAGNEDALKALIPKTKAEFYKNFSRVQSWKDRQVSMTKDPELF